MDRELDWKLDEIEELLHEASDLAEAEKVNRQKTQQAIAGALDAVKKVRAVAEKEK